MIGIHRPIVLGAIAATAILFASGTYAAPLETDCPLVHPANRTLKLDLADAYADPVGKFSELEDWISTRLDDGYTHATHPHAQFEIRRDMTMVCRYSEKRNRRYLNMDRAMELHIPLPGILLRCEIISQPIFPAAGRVRRAWCTHDPGA